MNNNSNNLFSSAPLQGNNIPQADPTQQSSAKSQSYSAGTNASGSNMFAGGQGVNAHGKSTSAANFKPVSVDAGGVQRTIKPPVPRSAVQNASATQFSAASQNTSAAGNLSQSGNAVQPKAQTTGSAAKQQAAYPQYAQNIYAQNYPQQPLYADFSYLAQGYYSSSQYAAYPQYGAYYQPSGYAYPQQYYPAAAQGSEKPKKKSVWWIVLLTVTLIAVFAGTAAFIISNAYKNAVNQMSEDFGFFDDGDYTPQKQPVYKGVKPDLTVKSAEGKEPLSAKDVYSKVHKSIVSIYSYDENIMMEQGLSFGSGFIISQDGYIVTNAHVLDNSGCKYKVKLYDDTEYNALLVAADTKYDIGIIKIEANNLTPLELGDSSVIVTGDRVYTIGNPSGPELNNTFCEGIISGLDRTVYISDINDITYLQTDAGINPGNSGGPLINEYGQVIGINTGKVSGADYDNLGFSIPMHQALPIMNELFDKGRISGRVRIGASVIDVSEFEAMSIEGGDTGVRVVFIDSDSSLRNTEIEENDIITHINGTKVDSIYDMQKVFSDAKPGDKAAMRVLKVNDDGDVERQIVVSVELLEYVDKF